MSVTMLQSKIYPQGPPFQKAPSMYISLLRLHCYMVNQYKTKNIQSHLLGSP